MSLAARRARRCAGGAALLSALTLALPVLSGPAAAGPLGAVPPVAFGPLVAVPLAPGASGTLSSVACASPTACVAVGALGPGVPAAAAATETAGRWRWTPPQAIGPTGSAGRLTGVACPTPRRCVAVGTGTAGAVTTSAVDLDGTWRWSSPAALPSGATGGDQLSSVACPSAARCVAVGTAGSTPIATAAVAHGWSLTWGAAAAVPPDASGADALAAVACASTSTCVAVGTDAAHEAAATVGTRGATGWTWTRAQALSWATSLTSVSCGSPAQCVAVGTARAGAVAATALASSSWTPGRPVALTGMAEAAGVGCATAACVAVGTGQGGAAAALSTGPPAAWGAAAAIPGGTTSTPGSVDCVLPSDCVTVGSADGGAPVAAATRSVPTAPRAVRAAPRDGAALVRWVPPRFDGGAAPGATRVVAAPSERGCVAAPGVAACVVVGLTNGVRYRFTATASDAVGAGPASIPSPPIAPSRYQPPIASPFTVRTLAFLHAQPGVATACVLDRLTGQRWCYDTASAQRTASIVKADILACLLFDEQQAHQAMPPATRALATEMIEASDNDAAQDLFVEIGQAPGLTAFNARVGLTGTSVQWAWGTTTTTALDQTRILELYAAPNAILDDRARAFGLSLLRHVEPEQAWGVSAGPDGHALVALKNGWYPWAPGDWQVNSIGWVLGDGRDYELTVLTDEEATMAEGVATIEGLSARVWSALGHRTR